MRTSQIVLTLALTLLVRASVAAQDARVVADLAAYQTLVDAYRSGGDGR